MYDSGVSEIMPHKELILRLIMVALLLYAMSRYAEARALCAEVRGYTAQLRTQLDAAEEKHRQLENCLLQLRDLSEVERLARAQLGYVRPGEIIFTFGEP